MNNIKIIPCLGIVLVGNFLLATSVMIMTNFFDYSKILEFVDDHNDAFYLTGWLAFWWILSMLVGLPLGINLIGWPTVKCENIILQFRRTVRQRRES